VQLSASPPGRATRAGPRANSLTNICDHG
jgi:hypothetical protein